MTCRLPWGIDFWDPIVEEINPERYEGRIILRDRTCGERQDNSLGFIYLLDH
jgi:hypothetical protein